jgi:tRNA A-37 threonylcarbamoyl transferase component Bud32
MKSLQYQSILSSTSHYGVVWKALYNGQPCAVKMVILTSGLHYDKKSKRYRNTNKHRPDDYFSRDNASPFLHTQFRHRKAMTLDKFNHEVKMIQQMSQLHLAPRLLGSWINRSDYPMHYGFIVMEYLPTTVKGVLLKRNLSAVEMTTIERLINQLHQQGVCHGDLKPSNIGIRIGSNGQIDHLRLLDWAKGEVTSDRKRRKRDRDTFKKHVKKNIAERS